MVCFPLNIWAFDKQCSPIDELQKEFLDVSLSIVDIHVYGVATATYSPDSSIESRQIHQGSYYYRGTGFVVGEYIITAKHVIQADTVKLRLSESTTVTTFVVQSLSQQIFIANTPDNAGIPATVVYISPTEDLAVLHTSGAVKPFSFIELHETYTYYHPMFGIPVLESGDCIVIISKKREEGQRSSWFGIVEGKVLSIKGLSTQVSELSLLNFTIDIEAYHGDSGNAIIAFHQTKPIVVGLFVLMDTESIVKYGVRIDPLLPVLAALKNKRAQ
jgi:hypothetical protein